MAAETTGLFGRLGGLWKRGRGEADSTATPGGPVAVSSTSASGRDPGVTRRDEHAAPATASGSSPTVATTTTVATATVATTTASVAATSTSSLTPSPDQKTATRAGAGADRQTRRSRLVSKVKEERFETVLEAETVNEEALKKLCWSGVPHAHRASCWKFLVGYLPLNRDRRAATLERKRGEYWALVEEFYDQAAEEREEHERKMLHQIHIDVLRTQPDLALFQNPLVMQALERLLFIWALRHPASGYVQGINDLATPFLTVFLGAFGTGTGGEDAGAALDDIDPATMDDVEADAYWCVSRLLDSIQDNYTFGQPGIQRLLHSLEDLVRRTDAELYSFLVEEMEIEFLQWAFRMINCLLIRELPLAVVIRLWDTYLAEDDFKHFHVYIILTIVRHFREAIMACADFAETLTLLQALPAGSWGDDEIDVLISEAFVAQSLYTKAHLVSD